MDSREISKITIFNMMNDHKSLHRKITANDKIYAAAEIDNLITKFIKTNASISEILTKKSTTAVNIEFDFHQTAQQKRKKKRRKARNALTQIVSTVHLSNKLTLSTVRRKAKIHVSTIPRDK